MRSNVTAGICSLMLLFALIACDSSGGNDTPPPKPGALSSSASYEQAMSKLDEIIAYCTSHAGNDLVKSNAESLKASLPSLQSTWSSSGLAIITQINTNLISQLTESGSENPGKPAVLSDSATYDQAMDKLNAIIAYCETHPGNDVSKNSAQSMKSYLSSHANEWNSATSYFIRSINSYIEQLDGGSPSDKDEPVPAAGGSSQSEITR